MGTENREDLHAHLNYCYLCYLNLCYFVPHEHCCVQSHLPWLITVHRTAVTAGHSGSVTTSTGVLSKLGLAYLFLTVSSHTFPV